VDFSLEAVEKLFGGIIEHQLGDEGFESGERTKDYLRTSPRRDLNQLVDIHTEPGVWSLLPPTFLFDEF